MLSFFTFLVASKSIDTRPQIVSNDNQLCPKSYTVQKNENLNSLSQKYGLSELYALNPNKNLQIISQGDVINIPGGDCDNEVIVRLFYQTDSEFRSNPTLYYGGSVVFCLAYILNLRTIKDIQELQIDLLKNGAVYSWLYNGVNTLMPSLERGVFVSYVSKLMEEHNIKNSFRLYRDADFNFWVTGRYDNTLLYHPKKATSVYASVYAEYTLPI